MRLLRAEWQQRQPDLKRRKLWFLDETGVNLSLTRTFGRAFGGHRAFGNAPKNYGQGITVLGAMNGDGELASLEVRGATDELVMLAFIEKVLRPVLKRGDVIVMDNLTSHKTQRVRKAFAELGVEVYYLPPYSPDLNPIEMCWSKFKAILKKVAARSYDALSEAISKAFKKITAADARSWIRHCGYV